MTQFFTGTTGDVTFDGVALQVTSWNATDEATEIETTTVADAGKYNLTTGKRKLSFSCEAQFDGDISYGNPPVIAAGSVGDFTLLADDSEGSPSFAGTAGVISCDYTHDLDGTFKYSLKCVAKGEYSTPS